MWKLGLGRAIPRKGIHKWGNQQLSVKTINLKKLKINVYPENIKASTKTSPGSEQDNTTLSEDGSVVDP
jgi:hypothetical protein